MRAYVLGAGASYPIYPLGGDLLCDIDKHIQKCAPCFNRFRYETDWPELKEWLEKNPNPLLRQAYFNQNIEQVFTVLDLAEGLILNSYGSLFRAAKKGANEVREAEQHHTTFAAEIKEYRNARRILLWAMEDFFLQKNYDDFKDFSSDRWKNLQEIWKPSSGR